MPGVVGTLMTNMAVELALRQRQVPLVRATRLSSLSTWASAVPSPSGSFRSTRATSNPSAASGSAPAQEPAERTA